MIVLKWQVPVDDNPHPIGRGSAVLVDCQRPDVVTVWTLEPSMSYTADRQVQVFGTGQSIPIGSEHIGSVMTFGGALVWHVFTFKGEP